MPAAAPVAAAVAYPCLPAAAQTFGRLAAALLCPCLAVALIKGSWMTAASPLLCQCLAVGSAAQKQGSQTPSVVEGHSEVGLVWIQVFASWMAETPAGVGVKTPGAAGGPEILFFLNEVNE